MTGCQSQTRRLLSLTFALSRDGYYFHEQKDDRIKTNEDLHFICDGSEKSRFQWLHKELF